MFDRVIRIQDAGTMRTRAADAAKPITVLLFLHELLFLRILPISTVDIPVGLQYTLLVVGVSW